MGRRKNIGLRISEDEGGNEASNINLAIKSFIKDCVARNLADHTIKYHQNCANVLLKFMNYSELTRTDEITKEHVLDFIRFRLSCGIKAVSINQNLKSWTPFGNYLCDMGIFAENPFNVEKLKVEKLYTETYTEAQLDILLETPNRNDFVGYRDYVLMLLFVETGVRLSEALAIKLSDIDWRNGLIKIFGKGRKHRTVPFQFTLDKSLDEYIRIRGKLNHDFVFVSIDNNPLKTRSVQDNFRKYGRLARIRNVNCTPHVFRFTFARLYIQGGGDLISLKNILGHTTLAMVLHYADMWGTDVAEKHAKFSPLERLKKDGHLPA